ncbi:DUF885 domain-containing protein [Agilicoccus flavus]|uniref:DUF885 domain-containing protein n=1 Tax=Agilicoccus flavus TaxID=2775968 RepID=UPI001CF69C25|nr:DUF885 domain-containing protein [Agilicoccus flavus]
MTTTPTTPREPTAVDRLAEAYVVSLLDLSPLSATACGLPGRHDEIDDLSPAGHEALARLRTATLADLDGLAPADEVDEVTVHAMRERLGVAQESYEAGADLASLNVIESPVQHCRDIVDLMPTDSSEDWEVVAERLRAVPRALSQYAESLRAAAARGIVSPVRQVRAAAAQADDCAAEGGFFDALTRRAATADGPVDGAAARALADGAREARRGYADLAEVLRGELLPVAPESDACGRERYEIASRTFLGTAVDLDETYAWGQEELARIVAEMRQVADRVVPGGSVADAVAALDADPRYALEGTEALRAWMQETSDRAIDDLAGTHFDVPEPLRTLECRIAPTQTGGIYYTGPADDFSRPGRMWWSVPEGVTRFATWQERTTVYHEGVPGHHLQVGQSVYARDTLNTWRRQFAWTSGHGEGWALYAERLMAELGYLADPGDRLGWLDAQSLRAARVVIDIGVHCELPAPASVGGGAWTYDKAWAFLRAHTNLAEEVARFELDRYLGWPGQAPSYKIGERSWLRLRDEARAADGAGFDVREFHRRALGLGNLGLDTLRFAVLADRRPRHD